MPTFAKDKIDRIGLIGILINKKTKTETASFANGGPQCFQGIAVKPVDYKGGELSNLISSEFSSHHWYGLFNKYKAGAIPAYIFRCRHLSRCAACACAGIVLKDT